ncbi:MAG: hypothetical protein Ta2E_12010 [Mycoplasmoidaceae bacterium]|nr:MAG: hypothetical protein Ta2E_12010 [Mycoplasmoidaceae bacterium]
MKEIDNESKVKEVIRTWGILTAPGKDELTNPILQIEHETAAKMMMSVRNLCSIQISVPQNGKIP